MRVRVLSFILSVASVVAGVAARPSESPPGLTVDGMVAAALAGSVTPFPEQPGEDPPVYPTNAPCPYNYGTCPIACGACGGTHNGVTYECALHYGDVGCAEQWAYAGPPCFVKSTCVPYECFVLPSGQPVYIDRCTFKCYGPLRCDWPALPEPLPSLGDVPCETDRWNEYLIARVARQLAYINQVKTLCAVQIDPTFMDNTHYPECWVNGTQTLPYYDCSCMDGKWSALLSDLDGLYQVYIDQWWCKCHPATPWTTDPLVAEPRTPCPPACYPHTPDCCATYTTTRDAADLKFKLDLIRAGCDPAKIAQAFSDLHASQVSAYAALMSCCATVP